MTDTPEVMMADRYRLLALVGERPQVLTELVWSLAQDGRIPAEVHVLTTAVGEAAVRALLLDEWTPMWGAIQLPDGPAVRDRWGPLCRDVLGLDAALPIEITVPEDDDERPIEDIQRPADTATFEDACFNLVATFTDPYARPDLPLYGLVAGGRKTMGQDLATAFALYGRPNDELFHVLVPPECEENPEFFYPTRLHPGEVWRIDKRYPRLRELLPELPTQPATRHYRVVLNWLQDPTMASPAHVELCLKVGQRGVRGRHDESVSTVTLYDVEGDVMDESEPLTVSQLTTLLVLWDHLWRPGERVLKPVRTWHTSYVARLQLAVQHAYRRPPGHPMAARLWGKDEEREGAADAAPIVFDTDQAMIRSIHISELKRAFSVGGALRDFLMVYGLSAAERDKVLGDDRERQLDYEKIYAFPAALPDGLTLRITYSDPRWEADFANLAENWPFEHLPRPEKVEGE